MNTRHGHSECRPSCENVAIRADCIPESLERILELLNIIENRVEYIGYLLWIYCPLTFDFWKVFSVVFRESIDI